MVLVVCVVACVKVDLCACPLAFLGLVWGGLVLGFLDGILVVVPVGLVFFFVVVWLLLRCSLC